MSSLAEQIEDLSARMAEEFNTERERTGQTADLLTDDKSTFTAAINEVLARIAQSGGVVIDDAVTSSNKTWSSAKISGTMNDRIDAIFGDGSAVASDKVWSSLKTQDTINTAIAGVASGIADELTNYATKTFTANAISAALASYSTTTQMNAAIAAAIDALPDIPTINDATITATSVWSSNETASRIAAAIAELPPIYQIDDADQVGSSNKLWSSLNIKNKIAALIDDAVVSMTSTWSSSKIAAMINAAVTGLWDDRGTYDASGNVFPSTGGSGSAGAILKGDIWTINVAGTLGGAPVGPQQTVRAMVDAPGQTAGNWAISSSGLAIVDDSITDGITGRAPSQNAVYDALLLKENLLPTGGTAAQYLRGDKTLSNFGSDVRSTVATGLAQTTGAIAATDSFLTILGKVWKQLTDLATAVSNSATLTGAETLSSKTLTAPVINGFTEGGSLIASTATTIVLWANTDTEIATTGDFTCQLPAPVVGKSATITIVYNGAHTPTFSIVSGTLKIEDNSEVVPGVNGKIETWAIKSLRGSTTLLLSKTGEYTP